MHDDPRAAIALRSCLIFQLIHATVRVDDPICDGDPSTLRERHANFYPPAKCVPVWFFWSDDGLPACFQAGTMKNHVALNLSHTPDDLLYSIRMSTLPAKSISDAGTPLKLRRITVDEYHRMIQDGFLKEDERVELIDGLIVEKMPKNPPHAFVVSAISQLLIDLIPDGYCVRSEQPVTLVASEPEPDVVIARGLLTDFMNRHPGPSDIACVIEVADSSATIDLRVKLAQYAIEGISTYVVLNLADKTATLFTRPERSEYASRRTFDDKGWLEFDVGGETIRVSLTYVFHGQT